MKRFVEEFERHLGVIAVIAMTLAVIGSYLLAIENVDAASATQVPLTMFGGTVYLNAEPFEPFWHGIKVLWGVDSYTRDWKDLKNVYQHVGYVLFEIGRVIGFCVFFRAMYTLIKASVRTRKVERLTRRAIERGENVVAVHGDTPQAAYFVRALVSEGQKVAISDENLLPLLGSSPSLPSEAAGLAVSLTAPYQIIFYERDRDCIDFIERNQVAIPDEAKVFIHIDEFSPEGLINERVTPFSIPDICALNYWQDYPVYPTFDFVPGEDQHAIDSYAAFLSSPTPEGPLYRIVLIGDDEYASSVLTHGLVGNFFNIGGGVRYDVIGEFERWRRTHTGIERAISVNADELHFHSGAWYDHRPLLLEANRVIVCCASATETLKIVSELDQEPIRALHVRSNHASRLRVFSKRMPGETGPTKVRVFGTLKELCSPSLIIHDRVHDEGKLVDVTLGLGTARCNGCATFDFSGIPDIDRDADVPDEVVESIRNRRIDRIDPGVESGIRKCLTCPRFLSEWDDLDTFTKLSNYAVTAHAGHKFRMLRGLGIPIGCQMSVQELVEAMRTLPHSTIETLWEIEHIRWSRFLLLDGWTYAEGERNRRARTHPDLVPYKDLQGNQSKYASAYLSLCVTIDTEELERRLEEVWLKERYLPEGGSSGQS